VQGQLVEGQLKSFGLDSPELTDWFTNRSYGVVYVLESESMPPLEKTVWDSVAP
jgi:hypothetical protein